MTLIDPFFSSPLIEAILQSEPEVCNQPLGIPDDGLEDVPLFALDDFLLLSEAGTFPSTPPIGLVLPEDHRTSPLETPLQETVPLESPGHTMASCGEIPKRKRQQLTKRKEWSQFPCYNRSDSDRSNSSSESCGTQVRKCKSCDTEETPQWRAGPGGPGTLCNAMLYHLNYHYQFDDIPRCAADY